MKELNYIIERCRKIIIVPNTRECIHALYIGGSIKPQDRIKKSDIDIIGIVNEDFPDDLEAKINKELKESLKEIKCKLRVIYLSELQGGKQKSFISKLLPIRLFIRRIPSFPLIWGKPLKIEDTIGPYTFKEEIEIQIKLIKKYIINTKSDEKQIPFEWIPKAVLYLAALELVVVKKTEYSTSFSEIQNQLNDDKDHIVHDSIKIRKKNYDISEIEKEKYIIKAIRYMENISSLAFST